LFAALVSSVLGALAAFAVGALPTEQLLAWGCRMSFLASAAIFAISFYVRRKVEESPAFTRALERRPPERVPLMAVLRRRKIPALQVLLCAMAESSTFYFTAQDRVQQRRQPACVGERRRPGNRLAGRVRT
jgi:hypothetical protein